MANLRGNQALSGTWGEVWIDGVPILEAKKVEIKATANREDVQFGIDVDSKTTGIKCEVTITISKVYSSYNTILKNYKNGNDIRSQLITKVADPDAVGAQQERWSFDNVWWNDIPLVLYEKGALIEEELTGGCTLSDAVNLDEIKRK